RVTRKSLSVSASTRAPASSGWTIATTIFIGRRLYPASLEALRRSTQIGHFWRCGGRHVGRPFAHPSPRMRHPSLGREAKKLIDLPPEVRGHRLLWAGAGGHDAPALCGRCEAELALAPRPAAPPL